MPIAVAPALASWVSLPQLPLLVRMWMRMLVKVLALALALTMTNPSDLLKPCGVQATHMPANVACCSSGGKNPTSHMLCLTRMLPRHEMCRGECSRHRWEGASVADWATCADRHVLWPHAGKHTACLCGCWAGCRPCVVAASKRTLRMVEEQQRRDGLWRLQGITHTDVDTHYLPPGLTFGQLSVRPHLGVGGGCWGTRASTHLTASMRPQVVRASVPRGSLISMLPRIAAAQAVPSLTTNASTTAPFGRLVTGMLSPLSALAHRIVVEGGAVNVVRG